MSVVKDCYLITLLSSNNKDHDTYTEVVAVCYNIQEAEKLRKDFSLLYMRPIGIVHCINTTKLNWDTSNKLLVLVRYEEYKNSKSRFTIQEVIREPNVLIDSIKHEFIDITEGKEVTKYSMYKVFDMDTIFGKFDTKEDLINFYLENFFNLMEREVKEFKRPDLNKVKIRINKIYC